MDHTDLPAIHPFIHEWNEPSCLYFQPHSITALWPVLISRPQGVGGWVGQRGLIDTEVVRTPSRRWSPIPVPTDRYTAAAGNRTHDHGAEAAEGNEKWGSKSDKQRLWRARSASL